MWHYALALCMQWVGNQCADLQLVPQAGTFDTHEACQAAALVHQNNLYVRPGWQTIIRGTVCTTGKFDPDDRVYTTHVVPR